MDDKQQAIRDRDIIDIEAMQRQLKALSDDIPRMAGHYVRGSDDAVNPHIFNYLYTAKAQIDQASQLLSHAHLWLMPDDEEDV